MGIVVEGHKSEIDTLFLVVFASRCDIVCSSDRRRFFDAMQDSRKGDGVRFHQEEDVCRKDSMSNILVSGPKDIFWSFFFFFFFFF